MRRRFVVLGVLAVAVVAAAAAIPSLRDLARGDVPVARVRRGPFERKVVAEGNLAPIHATPVTAPLDAQEALKIAWLVPDGSRVHAGDVVMRFDPTDMQKRLEDGRADEATADSKVEGKRAESSGAIRNLGRDADIAGRELDYARRFQSKDPDIFSRAEIVQSEIDEGLASQRMENAKSVQGIRENLTKVELDLLDIEKRKARLAITQAEKGLHALEVEAPHDGILVYKHLREDPPKVGDQVWPGMPLAEIPKLDGMEAQVYVLEADAGGLAVGRKATVALEAHPGKEVRATVKSVAALAKARAGMSPVQYFDVVLELEHTDPELMKPGQRILATLLLEDRKDALTVPRGAVFEKDGQKIAYRRRGFGFEEIPVTLGPMDLGRVVIEKGLEEGDALALRDPTRPASRASAPAGDAPSAAPTGGAR
jgi:RND family efflux transporter MFP subunit